VFSPVCAPGGALLRMQNPAAGRQKPKKSRPDTQKLSDFLSNIL
jgi:hypothetical protein